MYQVIREEGPKTHHAKAGTPTMGGLLILAAILVPSLLWCNLANRYVQIALITTVWTGAIGFLDDYLRVVKRRPKGLVGRYKLIGQMALGSGARRVPVLQPARARTRARSPASRSPRACSSISASSSSCWWHWW